MIPLPVGIVQSIPFALGDFSVNPRTERLRPIRGKAQLSGSRRPLVILAATRHSGTERGGTA